MAENFLTNKCVRDLTKAQVCIQTLRALHSRKTPPGFQKIAEILKSRAKKLAKEYAGKSEQEKLIARANMALEPFKLRLPELARINSEMKKKSSQMQDFFKPDNFCRKTSAEKDKMLTSMGLKPKLTPKKAGFFNDGIFIKSAHAAKKSKFMRYRGSFHGGEILGLMISVSYITNFEGQGGIFLSFGGSIGLDAEVSGNIGALEYPKIPFENFVGFSDIAMLSVAEGVGLGGYLDHRDKAVLFTGKFVRGYGAFYVAGISETIVSLRTSPAYTWRLD